MYYLLHTIWKNVIEKREMEGKNPKNILQAQVGRLKNFLSDTNWSSLHFPKTQ